MEKSQSKSKIESNASTKKYPILNGEYEIMKVLGDGKTSKVYLCRSIKDPDSKVAMKLIRDEFLEKNDNNLKSIEKEI